MRLLKEDSRDKRRTVADALEVVRLLDGPSCSVLDLEDGVLVPFISDAIESVHGGEVRLKDGFLG